MSNSIRIAIADDESDVRHYFARALSNRGYQVVVTASNGDELVDRCQVDRPDLLITDIRMDGLSGIEAMQELAKDGPMPTILISAHYRVEDFEDDLDGQLVAFLPKPVKLDELLLAVSRAADQLG